LPAEFMRCVDEHMYETRLNVHWTCSFSWLVLYQRDRRRNWSCDCL